LPCRVFREVRIRQLIDAADPPKSSSGATILQGTGISLFPGKTVTGKSIMITPGMMADKSANKQQVSNKFLSEKSISNNISKFDDPLPLPFKPADYVWIDSDDKF
jgi:hypothetical protein